MSLKNLTLPTEISLSESIPGYPVLEINNAHASARVALHGAHVMEFTPKGEKPVIFTSREAVFKEGTAIRGGVPVCWPWFGAHPSDSSRPSHGFARNRFWELTRTRQLEDYTELTFVLQTADIVDCPWDATAIAELTIHVGEALTICLRSTNAGDQPCTIGGALHSYFCISDINDISIQGLDGVDYLDTVTDETHTQDEAITFTGEVDRVYTNSDHTVAIEDPHWKRLIHIEKSGSLSTVVWNPWTEKAAALGDLANDEFNHFVCVETTNALEDVYTLQAGESHALTTRIHVSDL